VPILFDFPNEWIAFLVFFIIIMIFIALAEVARKILKLSPELSRKFVHVMVGILVSLAPFFLRTSLPVIVLGIIFTILNGVALQKDSLKGMHTTERISFGTVYFPIAFTVLVLLFWERNLVIFIVAMLV
jgi:phytol kinase